MDWCQLLHYSISPGRILDNFHDRYGTVPKVLFPIDYSILQGCNLTYHQYKKEFDL